MATLLRSCGIAASLTCSFVVAAGAVAADSPSPTAERALQIAVPVQKDVLIDVPTKEDVPKCTIQVEKNGKSNGYVIRDPQGTVLRRLIDSDGDNLVDQWCYYRYGIEVYRDVDTNLNKKADQYRWLNTAGSRIGIDANEDRIVDYWMNLSAEEVTAELVAAIRDRDADRFARLLLTPKDLAGLGLGKEKNELLAKKLQTAPATFASLLKQQKTITPATKWVSFAGSQPGTIPAGTEESTADVLVYENVAAMIETEGKPQAMNVGTLVRTAGGWRLIDAPTIEGEGLAESEPRTFFFTAARTERSDLNMAGKPSDKAQQLMAELHKLGDMSANNTPADHDKRAELLEQLAADAEGEMREAWYRQLADMLSAAVQAGNYPAGIERLKALEQKLKAEPKDEELAFYAQFRWLAAEHGQALSLPTADFAKIQTKWIEDLEQFVEAAKKYPDSADAMLELAISHEFAGNEEKALAWYDAIVKDFPESPIHRKAAGAKTRLSSVGHPIELTGKLVQGGTPFDLKSLRGKKVVLIQYWATWCEPCKSDMPLLEKLRAKYKDFEVIGVNLDNSKEDMVAFLRENDPRWPQLFENGGLESRFATEMGIQTLPTMVLLDKQGNVVDRNIRAQDLQNEIIKLLK